MELVFDDAVRCSYVNRQIEDAQGRRYEVEAFYAEHPVARKLDRIIRKGFRFECGRFRIEGVKTAEPVVGEYCFWAKDIVAHILSPHELAGIRFSRHLLYMLPATYWAYDLRQTLQRGILELIPEALRSV